MGMRNFHVVYNTRERRFAECRQLCRVPKIGHSAKPLFAECRTGWHSAKSSTRQRVALPSATECPALGKGRHSAKALFVECNTRQRVELGKKNGTWRPSPPTPLNFFKKILCRVPALALGKEGLCRVPLPGTRQNIFFCFFWPIFLWGLPTIFKTPCLNLGQFWLFLLYFVSFFCFGEFYGIFQIWTTGAWNNRIWSFKKWYSWYLVYVEAVSRNSHEISSILLT